MHKPLSYLILCLLPYPLTAQEVHLQALFGNSAALEVDGYRRILKTGQTSPEGVQLLEANSDFAHIKFNGREQRLTLNTSVATSYQKPNRSEARLTADEGGHFTTNAWVNGRKVSVMVDSGATSVVFNYPTARRLGLNLNNAQTIKVSTANGITTAHQVNLKSVIIDGIKLTNVHATVHTDAFPQVALLGNSFLSRVDMQQQNGVLILRARY